MQPQQPNDPLVSVCIPAYNAEKYVQEAVDSVLNQTWPNVEIIVVDDGSSDATFELLSGYGSAIQVFRTKNQGAQRARNLALSKAKGEIVQFLDADNYLLPESIARRINPLLDDTADLVFSHLDVIDDARNVQSLHSRKDPTGMDGFEYCLQHNCPDGKTSIDTNVGLHKTEWIRKVQGFSVEVSRCHDKDLTFRLTAAGARLAYVDEPLTVYRDHAGPRITSTVRDSAYPLEYFVGLAETLQREPVYKLTESRKRALSETMIRIAIEKFRAGHRQAAGTVFECAQRLAKPTMKAHSASYRALSGLIGYRRTETLRALWVN